jgi:hypothetical protein
MSFVDGGVPEIYACLSTFLSQGIATDNTISFCPGASVQHLVFFSGLIAMILPTLRRVTRFLRGIIFCFLGVKGALRASAALSCKMRRSSEMGFLRSDLSVNAQYD